MRTRTSGAGRSVLIRREIARIGNVALTKVQFAGVSGQICSVTYELSGPEPMRFTDRGRAEEALRRAAGPDAPAAA